MTTPVSFTLNGKAASVDGGNAPLLFVLRNDLGLEAAHFGCGMEECGACTVAVGGRARFACTLPVADVAGQEVVTAEGLADDPVGAALIDAFRQDQVGQCGYCLSGILVSAFVLLTENPGADRAAIVAALDPHLCRCGAYGGILSAVERVAADLAAGRS